MIINLSFAKSILTDIKDFLFPEICIICEERIPSCNSNKFIDDKCFNNLGKSTAQDMLEIKKKINSEFLYSHFLFSSQNKTQKLVHYMKYNGFYHLGTISGKLIGNEILNIFGQQVSGYDFLLPVPLHKSKLRERGYNQSDYLCSGISFVTGIRILKDSVIRVKRTKSQTGLNNKERLYNVKDAFVINQEFRELLSGKNIILVDDVITTGSTINEVIKTIKENSDVKNISVISLAIAK